MRRRYLAAAAVVLPVAAVAVLKYFFPLSYDALSGYMVMIAIAFKSALLSFFSASKLKLLAFIKGLTFAQSVGLLLKRWFLDNVFAKWLKTNIIDHIKTGFDEFAKYFSVINIHSKIKNSLIAAVFTILLIVFVYISGHMGQLLIFTELKVFVISISKTALLILGKILGFVFDSWLSPILEVFALSYFLTWLEERLGKDNPLIRVLDLIGAAINKALYFFADLNKKYIDPLLNDKVSQSSQKAASMIKDYAIKKRIKYEYEQFDKLEKTILDGHIDAYHSFKGMEKIKDKKKLYSLINQKTKDHLNIIGFISRDADGRLVPQESDNSYYHDIFLLEGVASSGKDGIKEDLKSDPDSTDFWALNTSRYSAHICSRSGAFECTFLPPHSVVLIKTTLSPDISGSDVYGVYEGSEENAVALPQLETSDKEI